MALRLMRVNDLERLYDYNCWANKKLFGVISQLTLDPVSATKISRAKSNSRLVDQHIRFRSATCCITPPFTRCIIAGRWRCC